MMTSSRNHRAPLTRYPVTMVTLTLTPCYPVCAAGGRDQGCGEEGRHSDGQDTRQAAHQDQGPKGKEPQGVCHCHRRQPPNHGNTPLPPAPCPCQKRKSREMESIVTCCVCNGKMREPIMTFPCLHSACLQCLKSYAAKSLRDHHDQADSNCNAVSLPV